MKHLYRCLCLLALLALPGRSIAQTPTDTLPGHNHAVRLLITSLCKRFHEADQQSFETLTPKQADEVFMRLFMTSMGDNAEAMTALVQEGEQRKMTSKAIGEAIGLAAIGRISTDCPEAMGLILRTSMAQKEMGREGQIMNDVSAEERAVFLPIADTVCAKLAAADAREPLRQMAPEKRSELMASIMQASFLQNMSGLLTIYSTEDIANKSKMQQMGIKVAGLMLKQCPGHVMLLGEDNKKSSRRGK